MAQTQNFFLFLRFASNRWRDGYTKILFPSSSQRSLHMTSVACFRFTFVSTKSWGRWRDRSKIHFFSEILRNWRWRDKNSQKIKCFFVTSVKKKHYLFSVYGSRLVADLILKNSVFHLFIETKVEVKLATGAMCNERLELDGKSIFV